MRGLGRLASSSSSSNSNITTNSRHSFLLSSSFSTFSGSGGGRGRGRGSSSPISPAPGKPDNVDADADDAFFPSPGVGHGRGKPLPSSPILPTFSSWVSSIQPSAGRGRPGPQPEEPPTNLSKKPIFFRREEDFELPSKPQFSDSDTTPDARSLHRSLASGLPGAGRGKPVKAPDFDNRAATEENRHLRSRPVRGGSMRGAEQRGSPSPPRMSSDEAVKKAVGILRGGRGIQARGGRGGRGGGTGRFHDADDDFGTGLYLGDNADGERLAKSIGSEKMNALVEGFEEMSWTVLPSPMDDAYYDALDTNLKIECEEEYLMGEFDMNPDIDEKPPMSLRDALEKVKPFLMAYEGIQSQEEWEKVIEETMEKVPYMEQLIEYYGGPERVTAKQQNLELERVAKTLPDNVPSSVKRFTDRALLSLQSNPGWGFDKKCQFMDKLVWEVSQQYK
ncbi:hypothetical protein AAC387_Pa10g0499 [Persea americana]